METWLDDPVDGQGVGTTGLGKKYLKYNLHEQSKAWTNPLNIMSLLSFS